jgi:uncharacterized protein (DUF952 family)/GNAT superfamily N-acetyltransferase
VSDPVLLHLTTPADWRAALATGAVVPPSPAGAGFLHLSTPDQVHLPAGRLFAGRRDVVLLVIDPGRLPDPVRFEPDVPDDPGGMRFPHLHGPLPACAVVAVVPWRAGRAPELPSPGDAAGRARALAVSLPLRRAAAVEDLRVGFVVADPAFPHSREDNRVLVTRAADADGVEATVRQVAAEAGWPAPAATLFDPASGPVADELARRGWDVSPAVVMARWLSAGVPGTAHTGPVADVVPQQALHGLWDRAWRRELGPVGRPGGLALDEVVGQLVGREHRTDRVVRVVDLAVRDGGEVVAAGQLRIDGATAAVESVLTEPTARRRGAADAVLQRALQLAAGAGCDLVVLRAAALDWPQHWYARRGFEPVARSWDVARL